MRFDDLESAYTLKRNLDYLRSRLESPNKPNGDLWMREDALRNKLQEMIADAETKLRELGVII